MIDARLPETAASDKVHPTWSNLWCEGLSVNPPSARALSPIPKAPKAQRASLGCDLIRSSYRHPDLTPGTPGAHIEPSAQRREDLTGPAELRWFRRTR